ncbi:MAG: IS110 family transposase [Planctomycetota bacterium]
MPHSTVTFDQTLFIGLDVGDRVTHLCVLNSERSVVERKRLKTSREALLDEFTGRTSAKIVLEVGSQSRWMSSLLRDCGHDVLVADSRKVRQITKGGRKTDRRDAETLARLLQGMPELLGEVTHRGEAAQAHLALVRARDLLVRTRTALIQHVRGTLKTIAIKVPSCGTGTFHRVAGEYVTEALKPALEPILDTLAEIEWKIRAFDRQISELARTTYPAAARLMKIGSVGPLTSVAFVLTVDDPRRFRRSRAVGPWLGLVPRIEESGDQSPQLSISKTGDTYLRRILIQCAQHLLGPFGKDCALRRFGLRLCERGGKAARKRAATAVARKLAILMHRIWISEEEYEPMRGIGA